MMQQEYWSPTRLIFLCHWLSHVVSHVFPSSALPAYECQLSLGSWSSLNSSQKPSTEPLSSKESLNFPFLSLIGSSNFLLVSLGIFLHMHVLSLTGNPSVRKHSYKMLWETQVKHISSHHVYTLSSDRFWSSCCLVCNRTCGKYYWLYLDINSLISPPNKRISTFLWTQKIKIILPNFFAARCGQVILVNVMVVKVVREISAHVFPGIPSLCSNTRM